MARGYRLLAVDVDGTLLDSRGRLPAENRRALHRAHEAGLRICICTGRSLTETRGVIAEVGLDLDWGVFAFGAIVSDIATGRTLAACPLGPQVAGRLVDHFNSAGYPVLMLYDSAGGGPDYRVLPGRLNIEAYRRWAEVTPARLEWLPEGGDIGCPVRVGVIARPEAVEAVRAGLTAAFGPGEVKSNAIFAPNYGLHVVECFDGQVNKWFGIRQLIEPAGIEGTQVVAVGDEINDLEMIRQAGLGVAMGNAIPPIRAVARRTVATNDQAGVAQLIEDLLAGTAPPADV